MDDYMLALLILFGAIFIMSAIMAIITNHDDRKGRLPLEEYEGRMHILTLLMVVSGTIICMVIITYVLIASKLIYTILSNL